MDGLYLDPGKRTVSKFSGHNKIMNNEFRIIISCQSQQ
jgi:hypothetical protein